MDDGSGMSAVDLAQATRPGNRNPPVNRDEKDLDRFRMGLKSASFSQCRRPRCREAGGARPRPHALLAGRSDLIADSLGCQLALEPGEAEQDVHVSRHRGGRLERLLHAFRTERGAARSPVFVDLWQGLSATRGTCRTATLPDRLIGAFERLRIARPPSWFEAPA